MKVKIFVAHHEVYNRVTFLMSPNSVKARLNRFEPDGMVFLVHQKTFAPEPDNRFISCCLVQQGTLILIKDEHGYWIWYSEKNSLRRVAE